MTEANDNEEWEEWNMDVTFNFTFVTEGPFPKDMPYKERKEVVKEQFEENWGEEFYHAYESAGRNQLETSEPETYK